MEIINQDAVALKLVEILYHQGAIDSATYQKIKELSRLSHGNSTA